MEEGWRGAHLREAGREEDVPYPLPPISTLSAALQAAGPIAIAPELMGEEGLPAARRGEYDEQAYSSGGGFQSSSTRDDRWFQGNGGNRHPWEDGYRGNEEGYEVPAPAAGNEARSASPKPRKRRPAKRKEEEMAVEEDMEYAHPSRDPKLGPVFVHPPKEAAQACVRCHRIKRKCDAGRPRCKGCEKADVPCVFELSPATSSYVHQLKGENIALSSQIASAHDRISQLESIISSLETGSTRSGQEYRGPYDDEATSDRPYSQPHLPNESTLADFPSLAKNILSVRSTSFADPVVGTVPLDALQSLPRLSTRQAPSTDSQARSADASSYPPYQVALQAVETFYICNAISFPFLDKSDFLRDMDEMYARNSGRDESWSGEDRQLVPGKEFVLFMVIAIGMTNRERMGEMERGTSKVFHSRAMQGLSVAVAKEDILCVQSLILLGIYAMFDPSGISLWHVVGFAARVSVALGLHRRADDSTLPTRVIEQRKRVFYSLYNLDRLIATTLSKPLALADDDIDVELPSILDSDSPYRGIPPMALTQHIIKLRRLSGVILTTAYSVSGRQNSFAEPERAGIISDLHRQLDQWLSDCPVPPSEEGDERRMIHSNHSWFLLNYHQCLCLLYRPSPLYPITTPDRLRVLHDASTRSVDLYVELWHKRKVSYNLINVSMQFLACISLLYCLCEYDRRSAAAASDSSWQKEVAQRMTQCARLLEPFSGALPETAKYREIFSRLSQMLLSRHGPLGEITNNGAEGTTVPKAEMPTSDLGPTSQLHESVQDAAPNAAAAMRTTDSTVVPPPLDPAVEGAAQTPDPSQESAWAAMAQLWHDGGDFLFDERAVVGPHGGSGLGQGRDSGATAVGREGTGSSQVGNALSAEQGQILWNQI